MRDLRQLRFFVTVAELMNVSRAAEALNISQSALSRQLQALEADIGPVSYTHLTLPTILRV